ncbi:hypothetical protein [Lacticaseibacillus zhaodongensis]|uniref:hypothetical protein n=1 Tax=Lacticaseibacillus zhaodongensis TaxID=2668065 RepID=UPI0012D337B9|nr:hypothetical protein [Lacticaseibacillus zhaodongensis]
MDSNILKPASLVFLEFKQDDKEVRYLTLPEQSPLVWDTSFSVRIGKLPEPTMHLFMTSYILDDSGIPSIASQWTGMVESDEKNPFNLTIPNTFFWITDDINNPGKKLIEPPNFAIFELAFVSSLHYPDKNNELAAKIKAGTFFNTAIEVKHNG